MKLVADHRPLEQAISTSFKRSCEDVRGDAAEHAPVSVSRGLKLNVGAVQGGLRASIAVVDFRHDGSGYFARVGSALRYAMMREKGGVIVPVRKKLLSWQDLISGKWIFAKRVVQRPGGPRQGHRPWLQPAGDRFAEFMTQHLLSFR